MPATYGAADFYKAVQFREETPNVPYLIPSSPNIRQVRSLRGEPDKIVLQGMHVEHPRRKYADPCTASGRRPPDGRRKRNFVALRPSRA